MKRTKYFALLIIPILIGIWYLNITQPYDTISDMAYNRTIKVNYIYIEEKNFGYVPFIIIDNQYEGKTLLLRKNTLPRTRRMNDYDATYDNCEMDQFLNNQYYNDLTINKGIQCIDLEIGDESNLGQSGTNTKLIKRKIFLLSMYETMRPCHLVYPSEGKRLIYFVNPEHLTTDNAWWTRTPDGAYYSLFCSFGLDGTRSSGNAFNYSGIRPAFCLNGNQPVYKVGTHYFLEPVSKEISKNIVDD